MKSYTGKEKGGVNLTDFKHIYELYFKDVYHFIYSMCSDSHLAEEITQDTFIKALKSIDSFEGKCKINVWLCPIAKNTYFTFKRKQSSLVEWRQGDKSSIKSNETVDMLIVKENSFQIHKVLHQLKEPYKEVFILRVFGGTLFFSNK